MSGAELAELTIEIQNEMRSMEIAGTSAFGTDAKTCTVNVKAALTPAQESQLNQLFGDAITVDPEFSAWRSGATSTTTVGPPAVDPPALECEGRNISSVSPLSGVEGHSTIEDLASFYMREGWSIVDGWAEGREVAVADETGHVIIHLGVNKATNGGWSAGTIVNAFRHHPGCLTSCYCQEGSVIERNWLVGNGTTKHRNCRPATKNQHFLAKNATSWYAQAIALTWQALG